MNSDIKKQHKSSLPYKTKQHQQNKTHVQSAIKNHHSSIIPSNSNSDFLAHRFIVSLESSEQATGLTASPFSYKEPARFKFTVVCVRIPVAFLDMESRRTRLA